VLDVFRDVLLQTLDDNDPRVAEVKKRLRVVCKEEEEHVAWGEKETRRVLAAQPWLRWPFYGLLELQLAVAPFAARAFRGRPDHSVLGQLPAYIDHVRRRMWEQGRSLGFVPDPRPGWAVRAGAVVWGLALLVQGRFARSRSKLDKIYLSELGFEP
jgi:hypothetical protein